MGLKLNAGVTRNGIVLLVLAVLGYGTAMAGDTQGTSTAYHEATVANSGSRATFKHKNWETEFTLTTGMRSDDLEWSIARNPAGSTPNVLSELDWSNVESYQVTLVNRSRIADHFYLRGALNYAAIQDGSVRDSDYGQNDRTAEWSRSLSQTNGDELWDVSAGCGYVFSLLDERLQLAPLVGFSYHKQNLRITDGFQVISEDNPFSSSLQDNPPAVGPLPSTLNSSYFARWAGPWIGCDLRYLTARRGPDYLAMAFGLSLELHLADYYGEGNWNLRGDLDHPKSFEHKADALGISISADWRIAMASQWELIFSTTYQHWSTGSGTDRKFLADGGTATTHLNGVDWDSASVMAGAAYHF